MKAMVLAAGQGTRLHPITDSRPKALVPLAGRPMIEYALLWLRHYGIGEIIINLHHFGEQIEDRLGDGQQLGLNIMRAAGPMQFRHRVKIAFFQQQKSKHRRWLPV